MTLIERIRDLQHRAQQQAARQTSLDEVKKLLPLLQQARTLSEGLATEVQQLRLLRDQGLVLPNPPEATGAALRVLGRLRERFAQERRAERLTQRQDWEGLQKQTQEVCKQATQGLNKTWRDFVTSAYSGDNPENLERTLAPTEGNRALLSRYRETYQRLIGLARNRPVGREDFEKVREFARALNALHQGFDLNVPDAVSRFLRGVAAGGAPIDLLTDEVRAWLKGQGKLEAYRIVAGTSTP